MLNLRSGIISGILIIAFLICSGCTQGQAPAMVSMTPTAAIPAQESASPTAVVTTVQVAGREEMVAFVKEAVTYAQLNGKENALAEFSRRNGSFFRGVLYIYAYDANGTTIAHPVNPEKIGVNRLNEKDAAGNLFIQDLRQAALNGTGFSTYYYINPIHHNTIEKKLGYVMCVDSTWWLGSGIYQGPADTFIMPINETLSVTGVATTPQGK